MEKIIAFFVYHIIVPLYLICECVLPPGNENLLPKIYLELVQNNLPITHTPYINLITNTGKAIVKYIY